MHFAYEYAKCKHISMLHIDMQKSYRMFPFFTKSGVVTMSYFE